MQDPASAPAVVRAFRVDARRLQKALEETQRELLNRRNGGGYWVGQLSASALSTATAVTALAVVDREARDWAHRRETRQLQDRGLRWLANHVNDDGGWGDTTKSLSNVSTTALCWAAFSGAGEGYARLIARAESWLSDYAGGLLPRALPDAVIRRYGSDRTFSVPILTMCALCGRLGEGREAWSKVIQLPFELAVLPPSWYAALRLPVVSYALPALIAMGIARHRHRPSINPVPRFLRNLCRKRALGVLERIQPASGGYLEATPLTSFVVMSLAGSGWARHPVTRKGVAFLLAAASKDGSWPIDSNLGTWVTTLSASALGREVLREMPSGERTAIVRWLLDQQYREVHAYTQAAPGGWAWTDLPGGVPDADDTPGALLALRALDPRGETVRHAAENGVRWLLGLQNRDGGIPTFCRGWGKLPFDKSSPDLTAHSARAWNAWRPDFSRDLKGRIDHATEKAFAYLCTVQRDDGAWIPLWFGNQHARREENPTYGTARVLLALARVPSGIGPRSIQALNRGVEWLARNQNDDGGWSGQRGGPSSVEETAVAIEGLTAALAGRTSPGEAAAAAARLAVELGLEWLIRSVETGRVHRAAPIGFYFAKLWYYEELYPLIFTVAALRRARAWLASSAQPERG